MQSIRALEVRCDREPVVVELPSDDKMQVQKIRDMLCPAESSDIQSLDETRTLTRIVLDEHRGRWITAYCGDEHSPTRSFGHMLVLLGSPTEHGNLAIVDPDGEDIELMFKAASRVRRVDPQEMGRDLSFG